MFFTWKHSITLLFNSWLIDTDTNILYASPFVAYCVTEFETVFAVSNFGDFDFTANYAK